MLVLFLERKRVDDLKPDPKNIANVYVNIIIPFLKKQKLKITETLLKPIHVLAYFDLYGDGCPANRSKAREFLMFYLGRRKP